MTHKTPLGEDTLTQLVHNDMAILNSLPRTDEHIKFRVNMYVKILQDTFHIEEGIEEKVIARIKASLNNIFPDRNTLGEQT